MTVKRFVAGRVVVAVGMAYFTHVSAGLAPLPSDAFAHTSDHDDLSQFKRSDVSVIGGGASALDGAASLKEVGAEVRLIARQTSLRFNVPRPRPWWRRLYSTSGLGPGLHNQFFERGPLLFRRLPGGTASLDPTH